MESPLYIAVDLGAGSGRAFIAGVDMGELLLEEIHRFQYPPVEKDGHLRWDFGHIFSQIKLGLQMAGHRSAELGRPVNSIAVDTWAVDYGLLDADGNLIADPICYRDNRTLDAMERVFAVVPRETIFEKTGIQFQTFNTIYQLSSEDEALKKASTLVLLPDLINYFLTGQIAAEYTNATTTQLVNAATRDWDSDLIERLGFPSSIFPQIIEAGTDLGRLKPEIADETGLADVRVIATATHDTASAVAGAVLSPNSAYISSGTWSLIGVENSEVIISDEVALQNFTNEGGAFGTVRFLKNVMGLWILESCRREWEAMGLDVEYDAILGGVGERNGFKAFIFPDDERFLNPPSMLAAIERQLKETGQEFEDDPTAVSKIIFDSLAFRYATVLDSIENLTGKKIDDIQILGGGGRNWYLNQLTADASGRTAVSGFAEATVVGNVLVQAVSAGRFSSLAEARRHVVENVVFEEFSPRRTAEITDAAERYGQIESRFVSGKAAKI